MVVCPKQAAPGRLWIWRRAFWGDKVYPFIELAVIADMKLVERDCGVTKKRERRFARAGMVGATGLEPVTSWV